MSEQYKITVVIATYNRRDILPITLDKLARQSLDPHLFEVIVVDDGSTDDTPEVVERLRGELPFELVYKRHPNKGICYTQNQGIRSARAPIVCLIADDIHMSPHALEEHLKEHERSSADNIAVLGKVVQSPELSQTVFLRTWDPFRMNELEAFHEVPYSLFFACNISCKQDFLLKNGLFNEELVKNGAYAHEDVELGYRLSRKGLKIHYNKKALAYHYHLVSLDQAMETAYKKGVAWVKFREAVNRPEITIRYHVLHKHLLKDYLVLFQRENNLYGLDAQPVSLLLSQLTRIILFNRITVPLFWLPVMRVVEQVDIFSFLMNKLYYRCVISHFFHRGVADAMKEDNPFMQCSSSG